MQNLVNGLVHNSKWFDGQVEYKKNKSETFLNENANSLNIRS